ncbi:MAG: GNAT family N-acetyltransferase [Dehalococcoidia bacterium]|nr:GNAT family N-acetyltransferase [Dehalococcoidia bacterium]
MTLTVQREDPARLEAEWRDLLPHCAYASVFLSPTWLKTWWDVFARGGARDLIVLGARRGSALAGVVPLMREGDRLSFAGDTNVCDYMDFPCAAGDEPALLAATLRSLAPSAHPEPVEGWRELELWALREDSAALAALPAVCAELGLNLVVEVEDVCPQINLPSAADGWEGYLASLDKKDRHELRRKLRKLPQAGVVGFEALDQPPDVEAALDDFVRMYAASRSDKAAFLTPEQERFLRRIAVALSAEGLAEITFLTLNGRRVAGVLSFRGEGEVLLYNSGYDPAYAGFSVGLLSKALTLQRAIEQGRRKFDFLRGPEPYKYDLGAKDLTVYRCLIRRS